MTREYAKKMIKGHPFQRQATAEKDIENRDYIQTELVPVFELDGNNFQFTAMYKIRLDDGEYIFGRAMTIDELCKIQQLAANGEIFSVTYLKQSRIIVEIEPRDN